MKSPPTAPAPIVMGDIVARYWRLRGFENFMIDLVYRSEIADYLLDQLTMMLIENALILARAGVDILLLDDDVAMPTGLMIGPATWRRHFKDRLAKVINSFLIIAQGKLRHAAR